LFPFDTVLILEILDFLPRPYLIVVGSLVQKASFSFLYLSLLCRRILFPFSRGPDEVEDRFLPSGRRAQHHLFLVVSCAPAFLADLLLDPLSEVSDPSLSFFMFLAFFLPSSYSRRGSTEAAPFPMLFRFSSRAP